MERERAEARAEGLAAGRAEGRVAGLAEGRVAGLAEGRVAGQTEARDNMAEALRMLGVPETAIQEALRRSREQERLAN